MAGRWVGQCMWSNGSFLPPSDAALCLVLVDCQLPKLVVAVKLFDFTKGRNVSPFAFVLLF